ncbi:methyltransferase domain-containing protein [candidate division KSB1 bacterium]|nr:methyltransferase domain-containing protein [candidate division KSB1 bacterium]
MVHLSIWVKILIQVVLTGFAIYIILLFLNNLSYKYLKNKILKTQKWDLNICCGKTDSGHINVDIVKHANLPNFVLVDTDYLPFRDVQFNHVLSSHTVEHVDNPARFDSEIKRVGRKVTYLVPPLWDLSAAFNILEHKWLFLTFRTKHDRLPHYVKLPLAVFIHNRVGQRIKA